MIIPLRCMNCGNVLGNKYRAYQRRLKMYRGDTKENSIMYIDGTKTIETPEGKALNDVRLRRMCCRKHFLTHVDLIEKV
jgi:DNA-directed RNA polymerase subunit N (RpoN/RPB10)